jgi:predicted alpha/beta-hydrolase family hydrolase
MNLGSTKAIRLELPGGVYVTAKVDAPVLMTSGISGMVLAHGANNDLDHPLLASVAARLARENAALVLRFNFPYSERGGNSPDSRPVLEETFRRAYAFLVNELPGPGAPVFLAGKSLGGRFAAEFASGAVEGDVLAASGLVVLGYPLHAPGRQDRPNVRPLQGIAIPSLFFVGTRDPFCAPEEIEPILAGMPYPGRLVAVEGGDHSFVLPKSSGRAADDAYEMIGTGVVDFVRSVGRGDGRGDSRGDTGRAA